MARIFLLPGIFPLLLILTQAITAQGAVRGVHASGPLEDSVRISPLAKCASCPTKEEITAPGVGFALEMGYGTAALRLHDGKYQTVARVEGDEAYTSLLRSLAMGPKYREPDNDASPWEKMKYLKERAQRLLNKAMGRPATPQSAVLGDMVSKLRSKTEAALGDGQNVTAAVLSSPEKIRLTSEELNDALDYLEIRNLMAEPDDIGELYAGSAAYAGFGLGLCKNYTDPEACRQEEREFLDDWVIYLDFSDYSLSGTVKRFFLGVRNGVDYYSWIEPGLGLERLKEMEETEYWTAVTAHIHRMVERFGEVVSRLMFTGPSAADPRFEEAVKNAFRQRAGLSDESQIVDRDGGKGQVQDFVFATAKGAAEFAKRRQEVRCVEDEECKPIRNAWLEEGKRQMGLGPQIVLHA
ncbi:hypothetical protein AJ80_00312 [Polytolypa hystricis UAMH7299]|uniref:Uncharacterized protein n=1 Tax=Polytolypa hystricis (strain UAMH7299) TaxID=1447883 RepID=A0A2B7Z2A2_POLH7|nr:hypothetical protein AJ80_00312 [Polytolypa hystricis UAMH7299]